MKNKKRVITFLKLIKANINDIEINEEKKNNEIFRSIELLIAMLKNEEFVNFTANRIYYNAKEIVDNANNNNEYEEYYYDTLNIIDECINILK